jgi:predicted GIY-YIG superfamily endonuclease
MPNYNLGKIYRVVCNTTGLTYYGSTTQKKLARRMDKHRSDFKRFFEGKKNKPLLTCFQVLENKNCVILLVEEFPCDNKQELERREYYYILNNECVNKMYPTRTDAEYREQNKDIISVRNMEYRLKNRDKLRDNNKILTTCALCGITHTKVNKSQHLKSNKHKEGLILKSNPPLGEITE